ncbi:MAG: DUF5677 domain-containing protein [Burkholderiaceae bacterium]
MLGIQKIFESLIADKLTEMGLSPSHGEGKEKLERLAQDLPAIASDLAKVLAKGLRQRSRDSLREWKRDHGQFLRSNARNWNAGLDRLLELINMSIELEASIKLALRRSRSEAERIRIDVVAQLHARSIQISSEIYHLLLNGFADGAIARWRSLHEVATVADVLAHSEAGVSQLYRSHVAVENYHAALQYQTHAAALGERKLSSQAMARITKERNKAIAANGESFAKDYGWAAKLLAKSGRITFFDLEEFTGYEYLRPYYKFASQNVHASAKGVMFRLGLDDQSQGKILLAGPSNAGLTEPGVLTVSSLVRTGKAVLHLVPSVDSLVLGSLFETWASRADQGFHSGWMEYQKKLERGKKKVTRRREEKSD